MKITYFTLENINAGLFKNQVVEQLKAIVNADNQIRVQLVVINPFWKRTEARQKLPSLREQLGNRIDIELVSMLPPLRWSLKNKLLSNLTALWLRLVFRYCVKIEGEIIHCRSYWPTMVALAESARPVVFDMRSLYPAESVAAGRFADGSAVYKFWLKMEKECITSAAVSTAVSPAMQAYAISVSPQSSVDLIPISVNTKTVSFNDLERKNVRKVLGWEDGCVFVYSGSLGYYGLNVKSIERCIQKLNAALVNARFLVLSSDPASAFESIFTNAGVEKENYHITEAFPSDLKKWLSAADIGIHALPVQLDSSTRLGTKVVEYWAAGLPVIVNEHVGAAADFIREYEIGYVLHDDEEDKNTIHAKVQELWDADRAKIRNCCIALFDVAHIAEKYVKVYKEILSKK